MARKTYTREVFGHTLAVSATSDSTEIGMASAPSCSGRAIGCHEEPSLPENDPSCVRPRTDYRPYRPSAVPTTGRANHRPKRLRAIASARLSRLCTCPTFTPFLFVPPAQ